VGPRQSDLGHQVVARPATTVAGLGHEVHAHLGSGLQGLRRDLRRIGGALHHGSVERGQPWAVVSRESEEGAHHPARQGPGEMFRRVGFSGCGHLREQLIDVPLDHRLQGGDALRCEARPDDGPELVVLRWVHIEKVTRAEDQLSELVQVDASRIRERPPVARCGSHVVESRQGPEPPLRVVVHGSVMSKALVDGIGIRLRIGDGCERVEQLATACKHAER